MSDAARGYPPAVSFTAIARRFALRSVAALLALLAIYMGLLAYGLATLPSPDEPVAGGVFSALELAIVAMLPCLVGLFVAVHAWAPPSRRVYSSLALVFVSMTALTSGLLHGLILLLSGTAAWTSAPSLERALSFRWPSIAYAIDIVAWDVWFALAMFSAAAVFEGNGLRRTIRAAMIVSGALAAAGLAGAVTGDMRIRNVGILGYTVGLAVAATLLLVLFHRTRPVASDA